MASFRDLKKMDEKTSTLVYGFCRDAHNSLPSNDTYYSVQSDIVNICAAFYWPLDLKIGDKVMFTSLPHAVHGTIHWVMIRDHIQRKDDSNYDDEAYWQEVGNRECIGKTVTANGEYHVGDRVRLTKRRCGTIKYIGKPLFARDERIGIDLDEWSAKGHDGRVGKHRYFLTKYGHGTTNNNC